MNPYELFRFVPLPMLKALALFMARVTNLLPNMTVKRIIDINLRLACPELSHESRHTLTKEIIRNQALSGVESIKSWAMPPQWSVNNIRTVHNQHVLTEALVNPNGMLAIVPHIGTWEMMNAWINQFDSPTIMYKPVKNKLVNDFVLKGRERLNATLVPTDASGVKAIFKTLKRGGFSIILPDHVPDASGGIRVPFFGIETLTSTLAPKLASKTKCALVGLTCIRNKDNTFDIYCIHLDDPQLYDKNLAVATTALNKALEGMIMPYISHYMWGYKRFKKMPILKNPYKVDEETLDNFLKNRLHT